MKLYHRESGKGQPIVLLHGIFGSSDNWLTPARALSAHYRTFALDLRNHGQSPHDDAFDYKVMAADVLHFMDTHGIENPVVIGHSMGGKVAMNFAIAHPDRLEKLIVVDIAPKDYDLNNYVILEGLNAIPVGKLASRQEADEVLAGYVPESDVRQFLLKNLQRKPEDGFRWKLNLPVISEKIKNIGLDLQYPGTFEKPVLFVRGARSNYIQDEDMNRIKAVFPNAALETLDTGHWVPAEKPAEFVDLVTRWIRAH